MELEKSLGEAQERERTRGDLEKTQVDRLLALADVIGSKYSAHRLLCFLSTAEALRVWISFGAETCGGAPPEGASSANVGLTEAVGFIDRVCAYASSALQKSTGALATVHRNIFPSQPPPVAVDGLAAPFEGEAATMADYTRAQTVRGSKLAVLHRGRSRRPNWRRRRLFNHLLRAVLARGRNSHLLRLASRRRRRGGANGLPKLAEPPSLRLRRLPERKAR